MPVEIGLSVVQTPEGACALAGVIDITQREAGARLQREIQANALRVAILNNLPGSVIATTRPRSACSATPRRS